ncbi:hypothetical protein GGU11DRAFT_761066, partial [Lentinula aff. detonsa]
MSSQCQYLDSLLQCSFERPLLQEEDGAVADIDALDDEDFHVGSNNEDVDMGHWNVVPHSEIPADPIGDDFDSDSYDEGEGQLHFEDEEDIWEPPCPFEDSACSPSPRSPSPQLIFPKGFFDEPLQLPMPRIPSVSRSSAVRQPYIQQYPDPRAGAPIERQGTIVSENSRYFQNLKAGANPWAPFHSQTEWEIARWAKLRGPSSTALTELLSITGVCENLNLSYRNADQLNAIIDEQLPSICPKFERQEVVVQGQAYEMYFRDILECLKLLYGDAEFIEYLKFAPERHYENARLDKHAGPGRTIIPILLSSDKTQVTLFRNKTVYPVYMTIGNTPKELRCKPSRCAYILVGYLPTTSLEHIKSPSSRWRSLANLFHACMRTIVRPLEAVGVTSLVMASGDGVKRHCHPIFAAYISDYPEQVVVTCCVSGNCPRCMVPRQSLGENTDPYPSRQLRLILKTLQMADDSASAFIKACCDARIKPVFNPFWAHLPYSNVYMSITPDILHQLYQGVFKHMKSWVIDTYGAHEIDARCRRLPPNHNVRIFTKGISTLQRIHFMNHYVDDIQGMGTLDNFNTEYTKRLHIDLAKQAYRASNKKDELSQMALWLERKEKVMKHAAHLEWVKAGKHPPLRSHWVPPGMNPIRTLTMAKHPSVNRVKVTDVIQHYGATFFKAALARFVVQLKQPNLAGTRLNDAASNFFLGVSHVSAYHRIKYLYQDTFTGISSTADSIHAQPARKDKHSHNLPGCFDTVLVRISNSESAGPLDINQDTRVGQVRIVFTLNDKASEHLFEGSDGSDGS